MTQLLEQAFAEASKLPEVEQDVFARWMLDEIISEKKWKKAFAESQDVLEALANEALAGHSLAERAVKVQCSYRSDTSSCHFIFLCAKFSHFQAELF